MKKKLMILLMVFAVPLSAVSTVVKLQELTHLIKNARAIGLFKVVARRYVTVNGKHVFTRYYLRALTCFAGCEDGAQLVIQVPGGKVSEKISARVSGAPELEPKVNYVLILTKSSPSLPYFEIAGFNQGAFMKIVDPKTSKPFLKPLVMPYMLFNGKKVKKIDFEEFLTLIHQLR